MYNYTSISCPLFPRRKRIIVPLVRKDGGGENLEKEYRGANHSDHNPVSGELNYGLNSTREGVLGSSSGGSTIWQSAVQDNSGDTVDISNLNQAGIEVGIAAITDQAVEEGGIAIVVTAADGVIGAKTCDRLCLVHASGVVT